MHALYAFLSAHVTSLHGVTLAFAFALIVALRLLLPVGKRSLASLPALFFLLSLACLGGLWVSRSEAGMHRAFSFLASLFSLASIGRSVVVLALDVVLGRRRSAPLPIIIRDLTQGLAYSGVLLISLREAGVEPGSILTTSALLTAVIGLSLQETLGNLFAGLAIQVQRPFDVGDWIAFDNERTHIGRVIEINWRATKVLTLDETEIIVPNGAIAKAPISNFTKPTLAARRSVYVHAPYDTAPATVQRVILNAIGDSPGVLREPPPSVVTNSFADAGVEYWVRFFTDQFHRRDVIDGAVRDRIWYALRRAGITLPFPGRNVVMHQVSEESLARVESAETAMRERVTRRVDVLAELSDEQRSRLATASDLRLYAPGEIVVRQGDQTAEMFVIERGEVIVEIQRPPSTVPVELARLRSGAFFGEMALMTGEPRTATVRTADESAILVIGHAAMKAALAETPELAGRISLVLAKRQAEREAHEAKMEAVSSEEVTLKSSQMLRKIREFFAL